MHPQKSIKKIAMEYLIVAVFFIGYLFITVEHQVKIDKTISALGMAVACWTILKNIYYF